MDQEGKESPRKVNKRSSKLSNCRLAVSFMDDSLMLFCSDLLVLVFKISEVSFVLKVCLLDVASHGNSLFCAVKIQELLFSNLTVHLNASRDIISSFYLLILPDLMQHFS